MAKNICVFCGAQNQVPDHYKAMALEIGSLIAHQGMGVVYGGGDVGLMGKVADGCLQKQGPVIGVIPQSLVDRELAHHKLTELHVVNTMHERKFLMADLAHAFLALPGGFGTFDELCEIITWKQLGIHSKPIAILNYQGFFDHFLAQVDHCVKEGFIAPHHREMLIVESNFSQLMEKLTAAL